MSKDTLLYQNCIHYELNSGYSATEAHQQINISYPERVGNNAVREWYNKLDVGDLGLENKPPNLNDTLMTMMTSYSKPLKTI